MSDAKPLTEEEIAIDESNAASLPKRLHVESLHCVRRWVATIRTRDAEIEQLGALYKIDMDAALTAQQKVEERVEWLESVERKRVSRLGHQPETVRQACAAAEARVRALEARFSSACHGEAHEASKAVKLRERVRELERLRGTSPVCRDHVAEHVATADGCPYCERDAALTAQRKAEERVRVLEGHLRDAVEAVDVARDWSLAEVEIGGEMRLTLGLVSVWRAALAASQETSSK